MSDRPNLLFVFADQMRGMDMGCAGNAQVRTPTLDRLAGEGTRFPRAYANCPVCTPSRGTILTGRYPLSHRAIANDMPFGPGEVTVAHVLRDAGYRTGYVGKWHLDGVPRDRFTPPGERRGGFDFWAAWNCAHDYFAGKVFRDSPEPLELGGYEPAGHTDLAIEFLRQGGEAATRPKRGRPFCLFVSWGPPHAPYDQVPAAYRKLYDADALALRPNVASQPPEGFRRLGAGLDRQAVAGYYAHVTALDEQLARLLAALDEQGAADDTIVVFTSDHGDMLWSQGMCKKEQPWEESIQVPLLIRWPGRVPAARLCRELIGTVDFVPTLLGLMGVDAPAGVEGADLSPVVRGQDGAAGPESVLLTEPVIVDQGAHQGVREWRGVRTKRCTYARWFDGTGWLLYDNDADPYQRDNLIDSPAHASLRARLDGMLDAHLAAIGDRSLPWDQTIRRLGLVSLWNQRERCMHPRSPRLLDDRA
jgi:arylsulfatase A-like enzyme